MAADDRGEDARPDPHPRRGPGSESRRGALRGTHDPTRSASEDRREGCRDPTGKNRLRRSHSQDVRGEEEGCVPRTLRPPQSTDRGAGDSETPGPGLAFRPSVVIAAELDVGAIKSDVASCPRDGLDPDLLGL